MPLPAPLPYELRIGVTGHRDLPHAAAVDRAVRQLLQRVVSVLEHAAADPRGPHGSPQSRADRCDRWLARCLATLWPRVPRHSDRPDVDHQTPLKLTVISCLARGADQIVARAVCDLVTHPDQRNRYLEAVLPFRQEIYERDFTDERDLEMFRQLLALDRGKAGTHPAPTVVHPDFLSARSTSNPSLPLTRDQAYADAGVHVVEASEMLIAVWDPRRDERPGGTGETVRYAVQRGRVVLWLNPADLAAGPFLLRTADRAGVTDADDAGGLAPPGLRADPVPSRANQLSVNFHRLAAYNRDPAVDTLRLREEMRIEIERLRRIAAECGLPLEVTDAIADSLLPHVVRADHLSVRYRGLRDAAARLWPTAAAGVVSLMAFQIIFLPDHYWLAFIEVAVLLLGYVSYRVSLYDAWHEKWLNDRRLAEGLRGAMFTALVLPDDHEAPRPGSPTDPLPFHNPANAWFVATLKRLLRKERRQLAGHLVVHNAHRRKTLAAFIGTAWIDAQAAYHERRAAEGSRIVSRSRRLQLALITSLLIVALLHAFGVGHGGGHPPGVSAVFRIDLWVAFATVSLPAWAAAVHVMLSLEDHERLVGRSSRMAPLLRGLARQLEHTESLAHIQERLIDVERILELETSEWAESLVDRKPEFTG